VSSRHFEGAQIPITTASAGLDFEVATIKSRLPGPPTGGDCHGSDSKYPRSIRTTPAPLGRCVATNESLTSLITLAYSLSNAPSSPQRYEFKGAEAWMDSDRWDLQGKAEDPGATEDQLRLMLQRLLADQFQLRLHHESKAIDGYELLVAKSGPKIVEDHSDARTTIDTNGKYRLIKQPMSLLAIDLSNRLSLVLLRTPVFDKTGLDGLYTFDLNLPRFNPAPDGGAADPGAGWLEISKIMEHDLGLRLAQIKVPVDVIIIDSAKKPAQN